MAYIIKHTVYETYLCHDWPSYSSDSDRSEAAKFETKESAEFVRLTLNHDWQLNSVVESVEETT